MSRHRMMNETLFFVDSQQTGIYCNSYNFSQQGCPDPECAPGSFSDSMQLPVGIPMPKLQPDQTVRSPLVAWSHGRLQHPDRNRHQTRDFVIV